MSLDWTTLTETLCAAADPVGCLRESAPELCADLEADGADAGILGAWGYCSNYDEYALATIVPPPVLEALSEVSGVTLSTPPRHAGFMHTYGYLLTNLETPFGTKRQRWVEPTVERGLGFTRPTLRPEPEAGTLLVNLTAAIARVLPDLEVPDATLARAAPWIAELEPAAGRRRIVETVEAGIAEGPLRLRTDLVPFVEPSAESTHWLVYSVQVGEASPRLVTAFPVQRAFLDRLELGIDLGTEAEPLRLRYNAEVPGAEPARFAGTRAWG